MLCFTKGVKGVLDAGWQKWDPSKKMVLMSQLPRGPGWLKQRELTPITHPYGNKGERWPPWIITSLPFPKDTTPRIAPWWHSSLKIFESTQLSGRKQQEKTIPTPTWLLRPCNRHRVTTDVELLFLVFSYWSCYVLCASTCCSVSVCQVAVSAPISRR